MSKVESLSNVQVIAPKVRPTCASSVPRRNSGSVQPVQPVQPFLESYKINKKGNPSCEYVGRYIPRKLFSIIPWTGWTGQIRIIYQWFMGITRWT
jgi:hypothetical protein